MIMADKKMPPIAQLKGRQLGRILIKMGRIRRAEVHEALEIQKEQRRPIGSILVELGHITKEDLNIALAAQVGMELIDIGGMDVPPEVIALVPQPMATTYKVVPYEFDPEQNLLSIAMDSPDNFHARGGGRQPGRQAAQPRAAAGDQGPTRRRTSTSSRSSTSSRCGTASTACCTRWCRRPSTWARRSRAA
jgi:hypothetical protein